MNPGDQIPGGSLLRPNFRRRLPYRLYDPAKYPGLYIDPNPAKSRRAAKKIYFERPYVNGRQTFRSLKSITPRAAHQELNSNRLAQQKAGIGTAVDPYAKPRSPALTVTNLLDRYARAGFPKKRNCGSARSPREIREQQTHIANLKTFFTDKDPTQISNEDFIRYHAWRIGRIAARQEMSSKQKSNSRPGHRAVDKERVTLSLAYDFAIDRSRETGIKINPFARCKHFSDPRRVKHCRDRQPESAEELHRLCAYFLESWRSEVLAWQTWIQSMIGSRPHEIVQLRKDARNRHDPGFIEKNCLFLFRSNTTKGTYPFAEIHPALKQCLEAHAAWHADRYPNSPWYFPSPENPKQHIGSTALTHGLARATAELGLPHRTAHGCRSYYVNVLRSGGDRGRKYSDADIALRIGQRTQGKLIVDVYGEVLPYPLTWIPDAGPAWADWLAAPIPAEQLILPL